MRHRLREGRNEADDFPGVVLAAFGAFAQTAPPKPAEQPLPSYKDLKFPALPQVKIPEPATYTLSNGMRLYLLEDHELPLVSGLRWFAPATCSTRDKMAWRSHDGHGDADRRNKSQDGRRVRRTVGRHGGIGRKLHRRNERQRLVLRAEREHGPGAGQIFKEVLTEPEFRQDKIDLAISQTRSAIARRNDEADAIAGRELMSIIYGRDTPYGWHMEYADVERIHREDLIAFYSRFFFPKNVMLAISGDFSTPEMRDKIEKLFAGWTAEQPPVPAVSACAAKAARPASTVAEKSDITQTFFCHGPPRRRASRQELPGSGGMADILGQGFSSRLVRRDEDPSSAMPTTSSVLVGEL